MDKSLTTYDPALIRGRARLLAQKAEAYYGLGYICRRSNHTGTIYRRKQNTSTGTYPAHRSITITLEKGTQHCSVGSGAFTLDMRILGRTLPSVGIRVLILVPLLTWIYFYIRGKQFALRDHLRKADAIIVLAGIRGNINFLNGKIRTATHLYQKGWAPYIIFTGKFSAKVTDTPALFPIEELQRAAAQGRIQEKDVAAAAKTWDTRLGATYMRDQAVQMAYHEERSSLSQRHFTREKMLSMFSTS